MIKKRATDCVVSTIGKIARKENDRWGSFPPCAAILYQPKRKKK